MTSTSFLPSEVARLVLGYIRDEGYTSTYKIFIKECPYLTEYVTMLKQGREFPLSVAGITLTFILDEYSRLKKLEKHLETKQTNTHLLLSQLQNIAQVLKYSELEKKQKTFAQSATQGARMKRQINDSKSPQKTFGTLRPVDSSARVAGHACNRQTKSPTQDIENHFNSNSTDSVINVTSVSDVTSVFVSSLDNLSAISNAGSMINSVTPVTEQADSDTRVPDAERIESCNKRLQELFEKNSPNPKSKKGSTSDLKNQSNVNSESNSAINSKETAHSDRQTSQDNETASSNSILVENNENTGLNDNLESHCDTNTEDRSVNEGTCPTTQSEITLSTSSDATNTSNLAEREPPPKEIPKTPQKPETSDVTNSNTCDSWFNGAPGVKGGDKLLERFGIQQSSSMDSTDQEVVEHMQAPVTPTKSQPIPGTGLVTPVKHLQMEENTNKSPRRKKPKTPRKRLSDINKTPRKKRDVEERLFNAGPSQEDQSQEPNKEVVQKVVHHMIHDETVLAKLTEISNVIIDHRQNRTHHKSGDEEHNQEPTAEELETMAASKSLEEILETESFGKDINLDLSDPVFEGLFKLFGTDKEAFHENLRREKHKTDAMEAEVEELEKSIHEEIAEHCGALINSQGDEGYETQRTPENIYGSPKPGCSGHTGTLEMSSPISQPYTPQNQLQETSFTSSPRDKENAFASLAGNGPVQSPIHPSSPYSNQSDLFSPASHMTHPFSPALTEQSVVSVQHTPQPHPSTPVHDSSAVFSPAGDKTLEPESPHPQDNVSMKSPAYMPSSPHIIHQNPPQSPDELTPALSSRRTPIPYSPLVKNDIQPSTPHMVQKYNTPFTPQSKHKSIMAAGTVRHLFSPQVYSPTTQMYSPTTRQNAQVMIQTNLENSVPQYTQEVEVNATSQTGTQTSTNQSMNYTNFVSGVNSADSKSTPINLRSASVFHGDALTTIDNTIGCISLPPSQSTEEMPPPQEKGKGKGKKGSRGKEKKMQKKLTAPKAQQGGFSTLIGLLSKPPQLATASAQPETSKAALSMPVLTEQADPDAVVLTEQGDPGTVLLNAIEDDIHNNSISILSPGGKNLIEVPILHCQDIETETQQQGDIVSQAMSASNVVSENETVCMWSQNLNTSTQLTIFSPPSDSVDTLPSSDTHVTDSSIRDLEIQVQNNVQIKDNVQKSVKKSSKKKLSLDHIDNGKKQLATSSVIKDTNSEFCQPGELLIAEPFHTTNPQKKVFMRSLNFGPNAGNTKGSLMPSRKAAKGSAMAPFTQKKSTDKSSDFSTVSVNLTKDIKYRKIMPKPSSGQIPVTINVVPTNQTTEESASAGIVTSDNVVPCTSVNDHYDSDTLSCGSLSPMKRRQSRDKLPSHGNSKSKDNEQKSKNNISHETNPTQSKVSRRTKTQKDTNVEAEQLIAPKSRTPSKRKTKKSPKKEKGDKVNTVCDENKLIEVDDFVNEKGDLKHIQNIDNKLRKCDQMMESPQDVDDHNVRKGDKVKSPKENLKPRASSKTGKGKTVSKKGKNNEVRIEGQEFEKSKETNTKESSKKGRKKTEKPLKVKIVSSKAKSQNDRNKQLKSSKSGNKIFLKSPVIRERKNTKTASFERKDSDSDDDIPLNVLQGLHKNEGKIISETTEVVNEPVNDNVNEKNKSAEGKSELNEPVMDTCPRTPEKTVRSTGSLDTPSQEKMLEKLGLTPKKNAEEILQNLQSPSRNLMEMLIRLTPIDKGKSPRRKRVQNHSDGSPIRSPSRSNKTPQKRLFGSPNKVPAKSDKVSSSTSAVRTDISDSKNKKSNLGSDREDVGKTVENDSDLVPRKDQVVEKTVREKSKPTVKSKKENEKELVEKKNTLQSLKKEEKKVTPLKLTNLLGNIKVGYVRNKESGDSKKRQREGSDRELENEISKEKPAKKARNSLDLSVLDYDKLKAKLSKIHK